MDQSDMTIEQIDRLDDLEQEQYELEKAVNNAKERDTFARAMGNLNEWKAHNLETLHALRRLQK